MTDDIFRRSFLAANTGPLAACGVSKSNARTAPAIPGFDDKKTAVEAAQAWKPFSDRKIRMGLVGRGFCRFTVQVDLQNHPNVELVAVGDLFPDRRAEMAKQARCSKNYPSLDERLKDDRIEAIFGAADAPSHARHCIDILNRGKHAATDAT